MKNQGANGRASAGYAMAALLVSIAVMGILMSAAMPSWKAMVQRDREEELIFRGEQYARAVGLFQRKYAGAFPPSVELLLEQKFLRKKFKDPMVENGEFQVLYQGSLMAVPGQAPGGGSARPGTIAQPSAPALIPTETGGSGGLSGGSGNLSGGRLGTTTGAPGTAGPRGGIVGVASKSTKASFKLYKGRSKYNEWQFVYTQAAQRIAVPGGAQTRPGMPPGGPAGSTRPGFPPGPNPGGMFPRPGSSPPSLPRQPQD